MLQEIVPTRQVPGEPRRRWFTDKQMDLIVWYAADDRISGFQICYLEGTQQKALTWLAEKGFSHKDIDDGEHDPRTHKMTPILVPDGQPDTRRVLNVFLELSEQLEPAVRRFVLDTLETYPAP
ncbi:MAG: hypothetical protein JXR37_17060 [Kiritimatiellae bacterium]|nr:hypothetical protein [Kiritimatiellia bacterium]